MVLEVSLESHNTGGVEKFLYEVFTHMNGDNIQIDFITPDGGAYDLYEKEIREKGGHIYDLGVDRKSFFQKMKYNQKLFKFLKHNKYDVVHINSGAFLFCLQVAIISKRCNIERVVTHSHNATIYSKTKKIAYYFLKPVLEKKSDYLLACSKLAAKGIFTDKSVDSGKVKIIHNGIEIEKFRFENNRRESIRNELGLKEAVIYGHVGRFIEQKNHTFLLDIFKEIQQVQKNAVLILIGGGPLEKEIKDKIFKLGLEEKVIFWGYKNNVYELLNCFDTFILPSLYEGLPIVAVEAQANGLLTVCSDAVTEETKLTKVYYSFSLNNSAKQWAIGIIEAQEKVEGIDRAEQFRYVAKAGYDIQSTADTLADIYLGS